VSNLGASLHFDASSAECVVYTYAEGLLSAFAHDLKLRVERFTLDVDEATGVIEGRFDASSLRVLGAIHAGADEPKPLSERDRQEIERAMVRDVLATDRHPGIRFLSSRVTLLGNDLRIEGVLTIHGETRPIATIARQACGRLVAETVIHKPDFGIAPYSALLGALRVKPDVRVRLTVPRPG